MIEEVIVPSTPGQSIKGTKHEMTEDYRFMLINSDRILLDAELFCLTLSGWIKRGWWKKFWLEDKKKWIEHDSFKSFMETGGREGLGALEYRQGEHLKMLARAGMPGAQTILTEWLGYEHEEGRGLAAHGAESKSLERNGIGEFAPCTPVGGATVADNVSPGSATPTKENVESAESQALESRGDNITSTENHAPKSRADNIKSTQSPTAKHGNATDYTISRFIRDIADESQDEERREELKGLLEEVKHERLSVNEAAIRAGYRKRPSPEDQCLRAFRNVEDKQAMLETLQEEMNRKRQAIGK